MIEWQSDCRYRWRCLIDGFAHDISDDDCLGKCEVQTKIFTDNKKSQAYHMFLLPLNLTKSKRKNNILLNYDERTWSI
jgi:hypothetical protein